MNPLVVMFLDDSSNIVPTIEITTLDRIIIQIIPRNPI